MAILALISVEHRSIIYPLKMSALSSGTSSQTLDFTDSGAFSSYHIGCREADTTVVAQLTTASLVYSTLIFPAASRDDNYNDRVSLFHQQATM